MKLASLPGLTLAHEAAFSWLHAGMHSTKKLSLVVLTADMYLSWAARLRADQDHVDQTTWDMLFGSQIKLKLIDRSELKQQNILRVHLLLSVVTSILYMIA
jgi:hypothetical protein